MTETTQETSSRPANPGFQIAPADLQTIADLAAQTASPTALRAQILLAADAGLSAAKITAQTGASRWQIYYWKRRYRIAGLPALTASAHQPTPQVNIAEPKVGKKKKRKSKTKRQPVKEPTMTGETQNELTLPVPEQLPTEPAYASEGPAWVTLRPAINLEPADTLAEAGRKVFSFFLARMLHHEAGTRLGEDIEELHDMRVATRRMRAAFDIFGAAFKPQRIKVHLKGLRATGRALGAVRDWDVFLEKAERDIHLLNESDQENLDALLSYWRGERESARLAMLAYLDSGPYRQFTTSFNTFVQTAGKHENVVPDGMFDGEPVPSVRTMALLAPVLIYTRLGAVRAFADAIPHAKIVQLHALRIQFKSLHYILDFLKEILGPEGKGVLTAVKQMQDHLGDLNDADVACQRLSELLENWEHNQLDTPLAQRRTPESLLAYLSLKHRQRHDLLVSFPAAWEAFDTLELRQQLAKAVAIL